MNTTDKNPFVTFAIVAGCSICFCSKGVFIKLSYLANAEPMTVLALRMMLALPVFLVTAVVLNARAERAWTRSEWLSVLVFGVIGYYFSPLVNFIGLQYVSVGLERMLLYSYPTFVVLGGMVLFGERASGKTWAAVAVTYVGIGLAYSGEIQVKGDSGALVFGSAMVVLSALSYSAFVLYSGDMIRSVGAIRFTSNVLCVSCVFTLIHFLVSGGWSNLAVVEPRAYRYAGVLAVFGTILPAFLMGIGLKRAGAQRFAVMSTVGPVTTVVLGWAFLGEVINAAQLTGLIVTIGGGLWVSLSKNKPTPTPPQVRSRALSRA